MGWAIMAMILALAVGVAVGVNIPGDKHGHNHEGEHDKKDSNELKKKKGLLRKLGDILLWLPKKIFNLIKGDKKEGTQEAEIQAKPERVVEEIVSIPKLEDRDRESTLSHAEVRSEGRGKAPERSASRSRS